MIISSLDSKSNEILIDRFDRRISYLRVSVTDRCNMRCIYCMPPEGITWQPHKSILSYEEIARVVQTAAALGIHEVRLTGGEPLVRRDLPRLVALLSAIPGIDQISLTTNALLLASLAQELKNAGLQRVNISLDTLDPQKYSLITRGGSLQKVWEGIDAAEKAGLTPIKINTVAMRGMNEDEILDLAKLSNNHPWHIRFIELMPLVGLNQVPDQPFVFSPRESFLPISEIKRRLAPLALETCLQQAGSGPAKLYRIPGALGRIGFISPISDHFCAACNRLRLTADGSLRACLLDPSEISIIEAVRKGQDLRPFFFEAVLLKPEGHGLSIQPLPGARSMRQIGG